MCPMTYSPKATDMSKEAWFQEYERLEAEHPTLSDEELSDMAHEQMVDRQVAKADSLRDEAKYHPRGAKCSGPLTDAKKCPKHGPILARCDEALAKGATESE